MKITVLLENKSCRENCGAAHGLALDIMTEKYHILFDVGPNELLWDNAAALGVDPSDADLCVLSHGHYDHGGGLARFLEQNRKAPVYARSDAFGAHAVRKDGDYQDIGIEADLPARYPHRFRFEEGVIGEGLHLFADITGEEYGTAASKGLLVKTDEGYRSDPFGHEQNLLILEGGKTVLIAGCAHRGIVNILARAEEIAGGEVDFVFAGFHLTNPGLGIDEPRELIEGVGRALLRREKTRYITGHCTGDGPYEILGQILGPRLLPMPTGSIFNI